MRNIVLIVTVDGVDLLEPVHRFIIDFTANILQCSKERDQDSNDHDGAVSDEELLV